MNGKPLFSAEESAAVVNARAEGAASPRLREVMRSVVEHLHDVVKETGVTPEEWREAIDFLTRTGQACVPGRQEFILLSDVLGVSMLVDALRRSPVAGTTESTVLGPFYVEDAPLYEHGTDICLQTGEDRGERLEVQGVVRDVDGVPIAGAILDVWQADDHGFYDVQPTSLQPVMNLRGRFRTDADGRYAFLSIRPTSYPIPSDGPVGELLSALGRHPYRPAHIHFIVSARGHESVTTHVFDPADIYLDSDAVFGVKPSLIRAFEQTGTDMLGRATWRVNCDFVLESGDGVVP